MWQRLIFFVYEDGDAFWSCYKIPCQNGRVSSATEAKMLEIQEEISLVTQLEVQSLTCKLWLTEVQ